MAEIQSNLIEMDFEIMDENFSRYLVNDGSIVKVKIVVKKIFRTADINAQGYPSGLNIDGINVVASICPPTLKREPSSEKWNPVKDVGTEMKFEAQDEKWQTYMTNEGFKILVKPIVTKIIKYSKYNNYGEPIYSAAVQQVVNIEKLISTA